MLYTMHLYNILIPDEIGFSLFLNWLKLRAPAVWSCNNSLLKWICNSLIYETLLTYKTADSSAVG